MKKLTLILFTIVLQMAYTQEQNNLEIAIEKQKTIEAHINEIEYINQKLQRLRFSGSYNDKYLAIKSAFELKTYMEIEFLTELNQTFSQYEMFKKKRDDLKEIEQQLFKLQFNLTANEKEYYKTLKVRREKNDILDSLEIQIDTLLNSTIVKFIQYTQNSVQSLKSDEARNDEMVGIYKIIQSLKEMDKDNSIYKISEFYSYSMGKKEFDPFTATLMKSADSIVSQKSDSIIKILNNKDFSKFVVDFIKLKEQYSYSPNISLLASIDFIENKIAYYSEINFRKNIKGSTYPENCTAIISMDGNENNVKYYIRNEPISSDEINMFYFSQKEYHLFSFDEDLDNELKNKVLNYFSVWSGYDILSQDDKKYISELLNNSKIPPAYTAKFKSAFKVKSVEELSNYLNSNEFYKVAISNLQQPTPK